MPCGALATTLLAMTATAALRPARTNPLGLAALAIAQLALSLHHGSRPTALRGVLHDHLQESRRDLDVEAV